MASLHITDADIPSLEGKVAIITGGSSGIGLAATHILSSCSCKIYILDLQPPPSLPPHATFVRCDTTSWADLLGAFRQVPHVDIAIANAGVSEEDDFLERKGLPEGKSENDEPRYPVLEVNLRGVLNFVKLAVRKMKVQEKGPDGHRGSIVITSSATAFAPEQSLPVYSATKLALIGLLRALRSSLPALNITINAVAPAATITALLPSHLAAPIIAAGLPVSNAHMVALALVYSATAHQERRVENYGKDVDGEGKGRWNGRVILTLGKEYTELEEGLAALRPTWFGEYNAQFTRMQQAATDFREI